MSLRVKAAAKRFLRGLIAVALLALPSYAAQVIPLLPAVYIPLASAFLLALDKYLRHRAADPPPPRG